MKKLILITFVLMGAYLTAQESKIRIEYYQAIINKEITKSDEPRILKDLDYVLQLTNTKSIFFHLPRMASEGYRSNRRYASSSGASIPYYRDIETGEKFSVNTMWGKTYLIKKPLQKDKWVLTKETKKIGNYLCHKAYFDFKKPEIAPGLSVRITAWYTLSLPFPFGPLWFEGLPGVILELDFLDYAFVAKKIEFNQDFEIKRPIGKLVTQKEVNTLFKEQTGIDVEKRMKNEAKKKYGD